MVCMAELAGVTADRAAGNVQLPLKLPLDQMQTRWKSILDPIVSAFDSSIQTATSIKSQAFSSPTIDTYYDIPGLTINVGPGNWDLFVVNLANAGTVTGNPFLFTTVRTDQNEVVQEALDAISNTTGTVFHSFSISVQVKEPTAYKLSTKWNDQNGGVPTVGTMSSKGNLIGGGCYITARPSL